MKTIARFSLMVLVLAICSCSDENETVGMITDEDACGVHTRRVERERDILQRRLEEVKELCREYWGDPEAMAIERAANAPLPEVPE